MFQHISQPDGLIGLHEDLSVLEPGDLPVSPWSLFWHWVLTGPLWLAYLALLLWMIYYCVRNDPTWFFWLWIMLLVQPFGAIAYFVVRYLPSRDYENWSFSKWWRKTRALPRLEAAATHIGNAYQHVLLGDALRDLKRYEQAQASYRQALSKEPDNLSALWGAASINFLSRNFADAKAQLTCLLAKDPNFKFGDASLLLAKSMLELGEIPQSQAHLEQHVNRWRQPEALYLLARLYADQGQIEPARSLLQGLLADLQVSPSAIARKSIFWKSRARRLLRRLESPPS